MSVRSYDKVEIGALGGPPPAPVPFCVTGATANQLIGDGGRLVRGSSLCPPAFRRAARLISFSLSFSPPNSGQIHPASELAARPEGDGAARRGLSVLQAHAGAYFSINCCYAVHLPNRVQVSSGPRIAFSYLIRHVLRLERLSKGGNRLMQNAM